MVFFRFCQKRVWKPGAVAKKLQVVIVHVVIVHVVELQAVTSYIVTRSKNVLVTLQHVQLQVTTGKTGKNSSKTSNLKRLRAFLCLVMSNNALLLHFFCLIHRLIDVLTNFTRFISPYILSNYLHD